MAAAVDGLIVLYRGTKTGSGSYSVAGAFGGVGGVGGGTAGAGGAGGNGGVGTLTITQIV